jgi:hypothetical protein
VVLSVTIIDASAGTDTVETTGKEVPAPAAASFIATVVSTALVPLTLAATIWLILSTSPEDAALDRSTFALVSEGVRNVVFPKMLVTAYYIGVSHLPSPKIP